MTISAGSMGYLWWSIPGRMGWLAQKAELEGHTLHETIDRTLPDSRDFDDFLTHMRTEGYEVKVGKILSFRATGQERFTRSKTIGAEYTLEALKNVPLYFHNK